MGLLQSQKCFYVLLVPVNRISAMSVLIVWGQMHFRGGEKKFTIQLVKKTCKTQYTYCEAAFNWFLYAQLSSIAKGVAYP